MVRKLGTSALALAALLMLGCGEDPVDDADDTANPALVGLWTATSYSAVSLSNPNQTSNVLALGFGFKYTFNSNGTYSVITVFPGEPNDVSGGTWNSTDTKLTMIANDNKSVTFNYTVTSNTLTLAGGVGPAATFNYGNGEVLSQFDIVLAR